MEERKKDSKERESESRVVFPLRSVLLDLLSAKKERKNALKKKKKKNSPPVKNIDHPMIGIRKLLVFEMNLNGLASQKSV